MIFEKLAISIFFLSFTEIFKKKSNIMQIKEFISNYIKNKKDSLEKETVVLGKKIFENGDCQILSQSPKMFELIIDTQKEDKYIECSLIIDEEDHIVPEINKERNGWDKYSFACLLQVQSELKVLDPKMNIEHKKYSREGMIKRVMTERMEKAVKAKYKIKWADNIYGDHILTNEKGIKYKIFLRNFENETGYSDSWDSKLNKLGTTKHIMFAFRQLKENKPLYSRLSKNFPFIEIYCDPLNEYKISWYYNGYLTRNEHYLIKEYFGQEKFIEDSEIPNFLGFLEKAQENPLIKIRPEVNEKIERYFEKSALEELSKTNKVDFSNMKTELYPYQKEGVEFVTFKKAAIIADEMGLGKTIQAISAAITKKKIFDFKTTLIICPASIKAQWKKEIEKFSDEKALIIQGTPAQRAEQYQDKEHFFKIINYETVLRDAKEINKANIDFMILDEAQRVKNYETQTANAVKKLNPAHILVITGTPIENRLIDIYSIVNIIDPHFFGPLWEFSYQHCLFDPYKHNKINGYYDLQKLNNKLEDILIRREKRKVIDQLPGLSQHDILVDMSPLQFDFHSGYKRGVAQIIRKKFITPFDMQKLQMLLQKMRMTCDSTYLVDEETNEAPKLEELEYILLEKLDIKNTSRKIIIFSEWIKVHKLLGKLLRDNQIGFVELNGNILVKHRGELIKKFETNENYKVFLSTDAGGTGLNLQVADTVINFELPWNPAKKNQRIGRIDRLGQKSNKLTVFNLITRGSIERKIAAGLLIKQNLFEGVLNNESNTNFVDFSSKGRSQFIQQLEDFIEDDQEYGRENIFTEEEQLDTSGKEIEEIKEFVEQKEQIQEAEETNFESQEQEISEPEKQTEKQATNQQKEVKTQELEQVMNNGMEFLSGLFKMATGKQVGFENQKIEIDKETGEVTMKFKLPM